MWQKNSHILMLELHNMRMKSYNVMFWKPGIVGCLLVGIVKKKKECTVELPTLKIIISI